MSLSDKDICSSFLDFNVRSKYMDEEATDSRPVGFHEKIDKTLPSTIFE